MTLNKLAVSASVAALMLAPQAASAAQAPAPAQTRTQSLLPVEQFTLRNGLKVIMHVDRSDPVVAVSLNAHVGSGREEPGRTGFAHLFEHLFFLESENLGKGGLDKLSARIGGSGANGSTSRDITDYLQTVPKDALEKMIWAEADKLGYFINTVTEPVLAKEKQVVKNEKRQSYDNQPYGHTETVIAENLYPASHPYSWTVIGSLADLDAAKLDDVRGFYRRWYVPSNVSLVIAGDFDPAQARKWVEKYFAEIPASTKVDAAPVKAAGLAATKSLYHEDNFAELPQLTMVWPTVPALHADYAALEALADLLTDGKKAPLNAVLIDEKKVTSDVSASQDAGKIAGELWLQVRAFDGIDLDTVKSALDEGFARFEREGVDPAALERVKTRQEVAVYDQIGSVLGKVRRLARYDLYTDDPAYADRDVAAIRAVTPADVMRVYDRYFKGKPFVAASFVPKGKVELALAGATRATVVEEPIVQGAEATVDASATASYARTASSFDRTVEPPYGARPAVALPAVWQSQLPNGLKALGIQDNELPLARFELAMKGGRLLDTLDKPGTASLLARMFTRGTARRTPAELEDALKTLGADIAVEARDEHFVISGRTLARNFEKTLDLVEEMLLEPRWDSEELAIQKAGTLSDIQSAKVEPNAIAERAFELATFGDKHIYSRNPQGSESSVAAMKMEDLKRFHAANLAPNLASFRVVGAVPQARVQTALQDLGSRWQRRQISIPSYPAPQSPAASKVLFYDVPGAKQSVFAFGYPALRRADENYYPASVMNYILGGGGFASRLMQELREGKGYTYGINSGFAGGERYGTFQIGSGVRANVTLEAAQLTKKIVGDLATTYTSADLEVTRSYLTKSRSRSFETMDAKLRYLANISDYGLPLDYPQREQAIVDAMSVGQVKALASRYLKPTAMTYVVVGDAATQAKRLEALGFGAPVMIKDELTRLQK
nr:pitrilysin family protein [uncultured Sphingosinicella sp.]